MGRGLKAHCCGPSPIEVHFPGLARKAVASRQGPLNPAQGCFHKVHLITEVHRFQLPQPRPVASSTKAVTQKTQQATVNWVPSALYGWGIVVTPREIEENEKGNHAHLCGTKSLARIIGII